MASKKVEARIGRQTLSLEAGKVAKQADGAVLVRYGDTVVLVAAVSALPQMPLDFLTFPRNSHGSSGAVLRNRNPDRNRLSSVCKARQRLRVISRS